MHNSFRITMSTLLVTISSYKIVQDFLFAVFFFFFVLKILPAKVVHREVNSVLNHLRIFFSLGFTNILIPSFLSSCFWEIFFSF